MVNSNKKNILIVDDEPFIRKALAFSLKRNGYNVRTAGTGNEALDLISNYAGSSRTIDLVVTDIQLPGLSGLELIDGIRQAGVSVPIIAISAFRHSEMMDELEKRDIAAFLPKPFSFDQLISQITKIINSN